MRPRDHPRSGAGGGRGLPAGIRPVAACPSRRTPRRILRGAGHAVVELEDAIPAFTHARNAVGQSHPGDRPRPLRVFLFHDLCPLVLVQRALMTKPVFKRFALSGYAPVTAPIEGLEPPSRRSS